MKALKSYLAALLLAKRKPGEAHPSVIGNDSVRR